MTWKEKFAHLMASIAELPRPQGPITAMTMLTYEEALADLTVEHLERARQVAGRTCRFFPSPAELRNLAGDRQLCPEARAGLALDAASRAIAQHGEYKSVWFDDRATTATIRRLGGWPAFCDRFAEQPTEWDRKEWVQVYRDIFSGGCAHSQTLPLCGYHETANQLTGYADAQPRYERIACGLPSTERPRLPGPGNAGLPQLAADLGRSSDVGRILGNTADALRPALCDDRTDVMAGNAREGRTPAASETEG